MTLNWQISQPTKSMVIHAGRLFDGKSGTYRQNVDILVDNNRIRAIEPHRAGRTGTLVDASTKTVMPGLFEMHTHQHSMVGEKIGRLWLSYVITSVREPGADPYDASNAKNPGRVAYDPVPGSFSRVASPTAPVSTTVPPPASIPTSNSTAN